MLIINPAVGGQEGKKQNGFAAACDAQSLPPGNNTDNGSLRVGRGRGGEGAPGGLDGTRWLKEFFIWSKKSKC